FLIKLINQESGFNQNAVSPVGAQGVAQFMPETAARMKLDDPFNPLKAVHASAQLLRNLLEQFGNKLGLAAAAYNAGPKRVQDWLAKKSGLPKETRDYVERITGRKADDWKAEKVSAQFRMPAHTPCQRQAGLYASNGPAAIPLPPVHPGSEPLVVAHAGKTKGAKPIVVASADVTASIPAQPQKKTQAGSAKAKVSTAKTGVKSLTLTIAAKRASKPGKPKKLQVAEARPHK
ncbi:MAG: lytic transglycosylase domain-containing protein, partial [Pseudolabrys sp.]|nr:lytic transglycosylase domain-containing protein [Pseudolabrys sp.]